MRQSTSIERPVGEGETNRSSDLEAVRNALADRGLCRRSVAGQWNAKFKQDLTAGVRIFQRKAGLEPDGLVIPGGPTAHALALGGDAQVKSADAQVSGACLALERDIGEVEREIAHAEKELSKTQKELESLRSQLDGKRAELDRMLERLGLGPVPNNFNLDAIFRGLQNVPEDFRPEARRVPEKARELLALVAKIKDGERDLVGQARRVIQIDRTLRNLHARRSVVCG